MKDREFERLLEKAANELGEDYFTVPEETPEHEFSEEYKRKILRSAKRTKTINFSYYARRIAAAAAVIAVAAGIGIAVRSGMISQDNTSGSGYTANTADTAKSPEATESAPQSAGTNEIKNGTENISPEMAQPAENNTADINESDRSPVTKNDDRKSISYDSNANEKTAEEPSTSSTGGMNVTVRHQGRYAELSLERLLSITAAVQEMMNDSVQITETSDTSERIDSMQKDCYIVTAVMDDGSSVTIDNSGTQVNKLVLYISENEGYAKTFCGEEYRLYKISADRDIIELLESL